MAYVTLAGLARYSEVGTFMVETGILLWIGFLVTAFGVAALLVRPFGASKAAPVVVGASDLDLYRSQLEALEADTANGIMPAAEAEAARVEIARRMIRAEKDDAYRLVGHVSPKRHRLAVLITLLVVPGLALLVYGLRGTPSMPAFPLAARPAPAPDNDITSLLTRVEAHLQSNPDDAKGWELLAPIYLRTGRYQDAATAYRHVIRVRGPSAELQSSLGEVLVAATQGVITSEALEAFRKALALDKDQPKARFYLAIAAEQDGKLDEARAALKALLADAPDDAPWKALVQQELARLSGRGAAPQGEAAASISQMAPPDQQAAIAGMVGQLAARLEDKPDDFEGWLRLLRAYRVMGEQNGFDAALKRVKQHFANDPLKLAQLDQFLTGLPQGKSP